MTLTEKPIFIVGVHRSGTTLLRYMLNSHPDIYIPPESDFIPRFFLHNPTKELSDKDIEKILQIIFKRYRFVKEWKGDRPTPSDFRSVERTPAAFLGKLYRLYARQHQATRWGDKTPIYSSYIELLNVLFPDAQFIHIIRDGRDVALSMLERWGNRDLHIDIYFAARNWVRRTNQARDEGSVLGRERYYELRYEDLVSNPEIELQKVCDYLGEMYFPVMAQPHQLGEKEIEPGSFHDAVRKPPSTARINRWTQDLPKEDLVIFQHIAGDLLRKLGYKVSNPSKLKRNERVRYIFLAGKYHLLQTGRWLLQRLKIVPPI